MTSKHKCSEACTDRTTDGRCKALMAERNAAYYFRNKQNILSAAAARRRYAQQAIKAFETSGEEELK